MLRFNNHIYNLGAVLQAFVIVVFFLLHLSWLLIRSAWNKVTLFPLTNERPGVSIVICARNEALRLKTNISKILDQDYPNFEVIVVDDSSDDDTPAILRELEKNEHRLHCIRREKKSRSGKREALETGIRHAKKEIILLTDADCYPSGKKWIGSMVSGLGAGVEIVIGLSPLEKELHFANTLARYELLVTTAQYTAATEWKVPYMAVGRNLLYTRELFMKSGGFDHIEGLLSGDDDLFVQKVANSDNAVINLDPESYIMTRGPDSIKEYQRQRRRHISTSKYYPTMIKLGLGWLNGGVILLYALFIALFVCGLWEIALALYLLRILTMAYVLAPLIHSFKYRDIYYKLPYLDAALIFHWINQLFQLWKGNHSWS